MLRIEVVQDGLVGGDRLVEAAQLDLEHLAETEAEFGLVERRFGRRDAQAQHLGQRLERAVDLVDAVERLEGLVVGAVHAEHETIALLGAVQVAQLVS